MRRAIARSEARVDELERLLHERPPDAGVAAAEKRVLEARLAARERDAAAAARSHAAELARRDADHRNLMTSFVAERERLLGQLREQAQLVHQLMLPDRFDKEMAKIVQPVEEEKVPTQRRNPPQVWHK